MIFNNYFLLEQEHITKTSLLIKQRKQRSKVLKGFNAVKFLVGDILVIVYWKQSIIYRFEGICISIKKNAINSPNVSIILRNVIMGVGLEFTVSYFYNRVYRLSILDYKRKEFIYKKAKLYYLRQKLNKASRINKY
jgi:ribosomal protein L19